MEKLMNSLKFLEYIISVTINESEICRPTLLSIIMRWLQLTIFGKFVFPNFQKVRTFVYSYLQTEAFC